MRRKLGSLDLVDRRRDETIEFLTLVFRNRCAQVLDFRLLFPDKDHQRNFSNSGQPGIANQLWVERQQAFWYVGVTAGRCFLVDQAVDGIECADRVNEANELIGIRKIPQDLDLQILLRLQNMDSIVLREALEQAHSLVQHAVPGFASLVFQWSIVKGTPFLEESCAAIVALENGLESFLKTAAKNHRCPCFFLPPAIQVMVAIAARAAKIPGNLREAISHLRAVLIRPGFLVRRETPPSVPQAQMHQGSGRSVRSIW